jgi:hypothetical protein
MARIGAGPAPAAGIGGVLHLDGGVAYRIESPGLMAIRNDLADHFHGLLTPQDMAPPRLHITIQNKSGAEVSRRLAERLRAVFRPRPIAIAGLSAWRYRGGPWEPIRTIPFRGRSIR